MVQKIPLPRLLVKRIMETLILLKVHMSINWLLKILMEIIIIYFKILRQINFLLVDLVLMLQIINSNLLLIKIRVFILLLLMDNTLILTLMLNQVNKLLILLMKAQ